MWTSLKAWKDGFIYLFRDLFTLTCEDESPSWTTEGLVGGGGDDIESRIKWIFPAMSPAI